MLGAFATGISAQSYNGIHKYDGEHKNELNAYFVGGDNVVADWFGGAAVSYDISPIVGTLAPMLRHNWESNYTL